MFAQKNAREPLVNNPIRENRGKAFPRKFAPQCFLQFCWQFLAVDFAFGQLSQPSVEWNTICIEEQHLFIRVSCLIFSTIWGLRIGEHSLASVQLLEPGVQWSISKGSAERLASDLSAA
jgi:hypothetical protein